MKMESNSINVIPAALWTWFWLTLIMFAGVWILKGGPQSFVHMNPHGEALRFNIARLLAFHNPLFQHDCSVLPNLLSRLFGVV